MFVVLSSVFTFNSIDTYQSLAQGIKLLPDAKSKYFPMTLIISCLERSDTNTYSRTRFHILMLFIYWLAIHDYQLLLGILNHKLSKGSSCLFFPISVSPVSHTVGYIYQMLNKYVLNE